MRTPLKGNSSTLTPLPSTGNIGPYDSVVWSGGYNGNNAVNGIIPLQINRKTGILRLKAAQTGLYVFAVLCQEYRNGVYIGQVRRDFQLLVKDCQPNDPPMLGIKNPNTNAPYLKGDTIRIRATDTNRCIRFRVQDKPLVSGQIEKLKVKAEALNFDATLFPFTVSVSGTTTNAINDTITATICFDQCTHSNRIDSLFKIKITATDNGCSLPKSDRDTLAFWVEPPFNNAPTLAGRATGLNLRTDTVRLVTGQSFFYPVQGKDTEVDFLYFKTITQTPLPANVQAELPPRFSNFKGVINTGLTFKTSCDAITTTPFVFDFILADSSCISVKHDTLRLVVMVSAAPNDAPIISVNDIETSLDSFQIVAGNSQTILLKGRDINNNKVTFSVLETPEFLAKNGITFAPASAIGNVETSISWTPPCLYQGDLNFSLTFVLTDDGCPFVAADTVKIKFKVIYLPNETPTIELPQTEPRTYTVIPSEVINISQLLGRDANIGDILSMKGWIDDTLAFSKLGATLSTETSTAQVRGLLNWPINCSLVREKPYKLSFVVSDNGCPQMNSDTLDLFVTVIDSADRDFERYNVTTPNDNLKNDVFRLPNLPPDNCLNQFVCIEIYNRWGKKVFYDNKRSFAWNAKNMSSGTYFYAIRYTNKVYKGWVDVLP
jgi:gliding motility-associated-like protein